MTWRQRLSSVVLWSVISAAFIGPGTVTTAVSAGSLFGLSLLWTVILATVSCILLQEVSARICIASGLTLGLALELKFGGLWGKRLQWIVGVAVILGCAAYEAGNILGAVSGMKLLTGWDERILTVIITAAVVAVLFSGRKKTIGSLMGVLVAVMGVAFVALASLQSFSWSEVASSSFTPSIPPGSELLALGLVGTTIVPYSIFMGAAVSFGQEVREMRFGLAISVMVGGGITGAILLAGLGVSGFDSFESLYQEFHRQVGFVGAAAMALGLFAAGFSSAVTSPYASGLIGETVFGIKEPRKVRRIWLMVLLTGFLFGISGVKPIPVILVVQALNGLILPFIAYFLLVIVTDQKIIPAPFGHPKAYSVILLIVLGGVLLISLNNVDKSVSTALGLAPHLGVVFTLSALLTLVTGVQVFRKHI